MMTRMLAGAAFGAAGAVLFEDPALIVPFILAACVAWELVFRLRF